MPSQYNKRQNGFGCRVTKINRLDAGPKYAMAK